MSRDYQIEVRDFGPIGQASVDVRPLTVFIGPSNTGKSYLATLIYALHQCFGGPDAWRTGGRFQGRSPYSLSMRSAASDELVECIKGWITERSWLKDTEARIPDELAESVQLAIDAPDGLAEHLQDQLLRYFCPADELVRRPGASSGAVLALTVPCKGLPEPLRYRFEFGHQDPRLVTNVPDIDTFPLDGQTRQRIAHAANSLFFSYGVMEPRDLPSRLCDIVFRSILQPLCRDAYYFPADRLGLMQNHQVIVANIVQWASTVPRRPQPSVPMLPGVSADFIDQMLRINQPVGPPRATEEHLDAPLESLLGGEIRLDESVTGHPAIAYRPHALQSDLPLSRASSMIVELAPVVAFLRHAVRTDDVIVIDEPEAHLHPAMQAAFTRELARLVRAGMRVVMTTHSEWVLETIGNLVRASDLPEERRAGIDSADVALKPEQVGAWLFNREDERMGAVVREIELDPDTGLYPADFEQVSLALYNESADIFNRLQEGTE